VVITGEAKMGQAIAFYGQISKIIPHTVGTPLHLSYHYTA
jgi:hypothetical protein